MFAFLFEPQRHGLQVPVHRALVVLARDSGLAELSVQEAQASLVVLSPARLPGESADFLLDHARRRFAERVLSALLGFALVELQFHLDLTKRLRVLNPLGIRRRPRLLVVENPVLVLRLAERVEALADPLSSSADQVAVSVDDPDPH